MSYAYYDIDVRYLAYCKSNSDLQMELGLRY